MIQKSLYPWLLQYRSQMHRGILITLYKQKRRSFSFGLDMETINFMWKLQIA